MGHKWQVAAEPILTGMGYKILKAQHRPFKISRRERPPVLHGDPDLNDYLWNFADYVTIKRSRMSLVDVKSQPYQLIKASGQWHTMGSGTVSFTDKEREAYASAKILVSILLFRYRDTGNLRRLGTVYYKLVPFEEFRFMPNIAGGSLNQKLDGSKTMGSREVYRLFRKSRAVDVVEVGPGYVKRERRGTIVIDEGDAPHQDRRS